VHLRLQALSAGDVGQGQGDGAMYDFLMHAVPIQYDRPGNFLVFWEDSQFRFYLQRFPRYESYGENSGRAYSGK
jgi:hypothetical protein